MDAKQHWLSLLQIAKVFRLQNFEGTQKNLAVSIHSKSNRDLYLSGSSSISPYTHLIWITLQILRRLLGQVYSRSPHFNPTNSNDHKITNFGKESHCRASVANFKDFNLETIGSNTPLEIWKKDTVKWIPAGGKMWHIRGYWNTTSAQRRRTTETHLQNQELPKSHLVSHSAIGQV